jgi:rubrerythrin
LRRYNTVIFLRRDFMPTIENLKTAFAGESQANRRYLAYSKKALDEGKIQVAKLFKAAAEAETVHAHNHLRVLGEVGPSADNLRDAIKGENYEHTKMYPEFIEEAKKEGKAEASRTFDWANQVEKIHEAHLQKALEALEAGKDMEDKEIKVCPVCGNTFVGNAPDTCPICHTPSSHFMEIK